MSRAPLEIETALAADRDGRYKEALIEELLGQAAALRCQLQQGLPPGEYQRLDALRVAAETAAEVVETAWRRLRSG